MYKDLEPSVILEKKIENDGKIKIGCKNYEKGKRNMRVELD